MFTSRDTMAPLKLIDFGSSHKCRLGERLPGPAGTLAYSAPEVLRESAQYGLPADVWAVGAMLYMLLTGEPLIVYQQPPAHAQELRQRVGMEIARKVCDKNYIRVRMHRAQTCVPEDAHDLLEKVLCTDPLK